MTPCDTIEARLDALADGALSAPERAEAEAHVPRCASCRGILAEIRRLKAIVQDLPVLETRPGDLERALEALRRAPRPRTTDAPGFAPERSGAPGSRRSIHVGLLGTRVFRAAAALLLLAATCALAVALTPAGASLAYSPGLFLSYVHEPAAPASPPPATRPSPSLEGVLGADVARLDASERRALVAHGAIWRRAAEPDPAAFYAEGERRGVPSLITADLGFLMLARAVAAADQRIDAEVIRPEIRSLARELAVGLEDDLGRAPPSARPAIELASDVVAVGRALSGERVALSDRARAELALLSRADSIAPSPLTGSLEDYSAYAQSSDWASAWFARPRLALDEPLAAGAALALVHALVTPRGLFGVRPLERYERIRERLAFFRGSPDDVPPERLLPALRRASGPRLPLSGVAASGAVLAALRPLLPLIPGPNGRRPFFSLLGSRYDAEAHAIVALTDRERVLGSGLDVLAATGFPGARERWDEILGDRRPGIEHRLDELARVLRPRERDDDLFWLLAAARGELAPLARLGQGDRAVDIALASLDPLAIGADVGWQPGARDVARILSADAPRSAVPSAIEPLPELFARLRSLARAIAVALRRGDPFPSRDALARELDALGDVMGALAAGNGNVARRAGELAAALAPRAPAAAIPVEVVTRRGPQATVQYRIVRGPIEVLALVPRPDHPGELMVARGPGLAVFELPFERTLGPGDVARLPDLPVPGWLRSWRAP